MRFHCYKTPVNDRIVKNCGEVSLSDVLGCFFGVNFLASHDVGCSWILYREFFFFGEEEKWRNLLWTLYMTLLGRV